eukprot:10150767-Alexandrium_andersonii.AAC.1
MSASLVGSEMCIRDSHSGWLAATATHGEVSEEMPYRLELVHAFRSENVPCLLYTSDAADDM